MLFDVLGVCGGLVLLLVGGDALVRGASALARGLGVSPTTVGLTVVAFGTSAPELVVSGLAAWKGNPGLAFGNVIGSNVANVSLLLGLTALYRPMSVHSTLITREIPMMVLASLAAVVLGIDGLLGDGPVDVLGRGDGIVLLLLFCVFLYYTTADVVRSRSTDPLLKEARSHGPSGPLPSRAMMAVLIVAGLVGLSVGGQLIVSSASALAAGLGVSSVVIGSTIVALGTSLPELATCIMAARQGQSDLALGNVVGSNIFNLLLVLGGTACLAPVPVPPGGRIDLALMLGTAMVLGPISLSQARITRREGGLLLISYAGFMVWQLMRPG